MTQIKIEVPANDTIALNAFAEALQRIAAERDEPVLDSTTQPSNPSNINEYYGSMGSNLNTAMGDMIKQFEDAKTPKGDDFVEPLNDGITPPEAEFTAEQAIEHIGNANDNPTDTTPPETSDTLDADGIPWDKRIHSKGKSRLADDTWRLRKRPADKDEDEWTTYIDTVKAELKAVQDIEAPTTDEQVKEGPFYWSHDESDSCGVVQTDEQLREMLDSDPLCNEISKENYDKKVGMGYDNGTNNLTPSTLDEQAVEPTIDEQAVADVQSPVTPPASVTPPVAAVTPPASVTPPVIDTDTPQGMSEANEPAVKTFPELMKYITTSAAKRGANNDMIKEVLLEVDASLTAIPLIANRVDLIPTFVEKLKVRLA